MIMQTREETESKHKDILKILAIKISLANAANQDQFIYSIQFNIEESDTCAYVM